MALPLSPLPRDRTEASNAILLAGDIPPDFLYKEQLDSILYHILRRAPTEGDISYDILARDDAYHASVTLYGYGGCAYVGEPAQSPQEAKNLAAKAVFAALQKGVIFSATAPSEPDLFEAFVGCFGDCFRPQCPSYDSAKLFGAKSSSSTGDSQSKHLTLRSLIDIDCTYSNSKTELNSFVQARCRRCMRKGDVVYRSVRTKRFAWQASVRLACLGGAVFEGEVRKTMTEAEISAAWNAMQFYREEIEDFNRTLREQKDRMMASVHGGSAEQEPELLFTDAQALSQEDSGNVCAIAKLAKCQKPRALICVNGATTNPKTELNAFCQAACGRSMRRRDIVFNMTPVVRNRMVSYCARVVLMCLGGTEYVSEPRESPKSAEMDAARKALLAHRDEIDSLNLRTRKQLPGEWTSALTIPEDAIGE